MIPVNELTLGAPYQRPIDTARAKQYAEDFNEDQLQIITVSDRGHGVLVVVDGQHRVHAASLLDAAYPILCELIRGLTVEQEAELYVNLNRKRKAPNVQELFKARLAAKDEVALSVLDIAVTTGYTITLAGGGSKRNIKAVGALDSVYRRDNGVSLRKLLGATAEAWGVEESPTQITIRALGSFIGFYKATYSHQRLVEILMSTPQRRLEAGIKTYAGELHAAGGSGAIGNAGAMYILRLYNRGLRTRKLGPWLPSKYTEFSVKRTHEVSQ